MRRTEPTASALSWSLILHHCPRTATPIRCRLRGRVERLVHGARPRVPVPSRAGPDRNRLRRSHRHRERDAPAPDGQPDLQHEPLRLQLVLNGGSAATPFTRTVIAGSNNSVSAPSPQTLNGSSYGFASWSDGGAQTHNIIASSTATYTAVFAPPTTRPPAITGPTMVGKSIKTSNGSWTGSTPISFTYQWRRCDASGAACGYPGANASKYLLVTADGPDDARDRHRDELRRLQLGDLGAKRRDQTARWLARIDA